MKSIINFCSKRHLFKISQEKQVLASPTVKVKAKQKFGLPGRLKESIPSVWNEYTALAVKYNPLSLAHGFPDFAPPSHLIEALVKATTSSNPLLNQYTRGFGHPRLVQKISELYSKVTKHDIDPMNEVLVTCGAYEALYASIMGHVDIADEVIIIEPFFDCYEPMVKMAGGIPRFIALKGRESEIKTSNDLILNYDELKCLFNERTKMIILNTPHNPTGKVFTAVELQTIAEQCIKWDVLCLTDEVYEWTVFKGKEHVRISSLPGMWERTITVGSAGKAFSATGWKIGWAYGPANLLVNLQMIHQNSVYTNATPIQEAIASAIEFELSRFNSSECFFNSFPLKLKEKCDKMASFLEEIGMKPILPDAGYFMFANWSGLESTIDLSTEKDPYRDYQFTKWMVKNIGVQTIPPSAFYSKTNKRLGENYVRFCFAKKNENLMKAKKLLQKLKLEFEE